MNSGTYATANARLTANIDLSGYDDWTPIGDDTTPYSGKFDGGGYTISYLKINSSSSYVGLFGYVGTGGSVQNLTLHEPNITSSHNYGYAGAIAGMNYGTIANCHVSEGSVSGNYDAGGIVGANRDGTVSNCTNSGSVSANTAGGNTAGGVVGYNSVFRQGIASVANCTNSGGVSGGQRAGGGIVGYNEGDQGTASVKNCGWLEGTANLDIGGSGTNATSDNVASFTEAKMPEIAVTLTASIENNAIAKNGSTTITLAAPPGEIADVVNAGGLINPYCTDDGSDLVDVSYNGDGTFTAEAKGTAGETKITVSARLYTYDFENKEYDTESDPADYEFTFNLTVTDDVALEEITLSEPSLKMTVGETHTLTVSYEPENTTQRDITWTSSDETVAAVSGGVVTAIAAGNATITAASDENPSVFATCVVTVTVSGTGETPGTPAAPGGGCDAGWGALALLAALPFALRRKR